MYEFNWGKWDFDLDGDAYVINKKQCPMKADVPDFILEEDNLHEDCKQGIIDQGIQQGWIRYGKCNYWDDSYTGRSGFEVQIDNDNLHFKKNWDPVWIVRIGDWY